MKEATKSAADAGGVVGPDVVAACALSAVPGLGARGLMRLAQEFETLAGAMMAGPDAILARAGDLELRQQARDFFAREPDLEELGLWAVAAARAAGARVVVLGDDWYPSELRLIESPPALLYVRGHLQAHAPRIAVVGSREADPAGLELARTFGDGFARAGVQTISGGARGVDTAAHDGALWGTGSTIAVLGSGIDVVYPRENAELFNRIANGGGAVVSEFPPGTPPAQANFPRRNRTIAGLSQAVVVVRAALKSGALLTADHAAKEDRRLFAVPGDVSNPFSAGPNELLRTGRALACTGPRDVLESLGWPVPRELTDPPPELQSREVVPAFSTPEPALPRPASDQQVLDEESLGLWRLLDDRTPAHVDDLAGRARIPVQQALRRLAELELKGMCLQRPGKYFLRR